jgi:hypothetical protein
MANAPDFDYKMLLLATQLANDTNMKQLLLSVLETLLITIQKQPDSRYTHLDSLPLIRCIIRLVIKLMGEPISTGCAIVVDVHWDQANVMHPPQAMTCCRHC